MSWPYYNFGTSHPPTRNSLKYNFYVKHSSEIDLTKGTYVPEAPRIQRLTTTDGGHSEEVANSLAKEKPGRLVGSPKKASPNKKVKKTGMYKIVTSLCL